MYLSHQQNLNNLTFIVLAKANKYNNVFKHLREQYKENILKTVNRKTYKEIVCIKKKKKENTKETLHSVFFLSFPDYNGCFNYRLSSTTARLSDIRATDHYNGALRIQQ